MLCYCNYILFVIYYVTSRSFQRKFYNLEVTKIVITKKYIYSSLYTKKQQNIKTFKYDWKLVDRNFPENGTCPVYGELNL